MRNAWTARVVAVITVLLLTASGCAGSRVAAERDYGGADPEAGMIPELNLPAELNASVGTLVNYNPYAPDPVTRSWLYEPLMIQSSLDCNITPWLATGYEWSDDASTLTFEIRQGVKWSDGTDMTPEDVAFTFTMLKEYPAADRAGVWTETLGAPAKEVRVEGHSVVIDFAGNAAPKLTGILNEVLIVQKAQFADAGDPTQYVQEDPISTGPFRVDSYNGRRLELVRRDDYWQADTFKVQKLVLEGNYDATQAAAKLRAGEIDFYSGDIPNPDKTFVSADPETNKLWFPANGTTALAPNHKRVPFNDPKFREAMAYGIDKQQAAEKGTFGLMDVGSQSGMPMPNKAPMLPDGLSPEDTVVKYDPGRANQILDDAGYTKGSDGYRQTPDGKPIDIIISIPPFIPSEALADQAVSDYRKLGIKIKLNKQHPEAIDRAKKNRDYDLLVDYIHSGCDFANAFGGKLDDRKISDDENIRPNLAQYSNPEVNAAIDRLQVATDQAAIRADVGVLVEVMMTEFPYISVMYAPSRGIFNTENAVGWPTEEDPYANPADNNRLWMSRLHAPPT